MHKILSLIAYSRYRKISIKTGISIPKNTCEAGLSIPHFGSIVVNANCKIGKNCKIHNNVNIGANRGSNKAPKIGDNVYIGQGAVIFGDIEIADNCYIGANAVVNKSFLQPYSGIPARVIKIETENWLDNRNQL
jgi:serine O-acetyltransferase